MLLIFVFFKQKTAYEMRISDWSSDVCSSDLSDAMAGELFPCVEAQDRQAIRSIPYRARAALRKPVLGSGQQGGAANVCRETESGRRESRDDRSEEHTSELQSLMRISYAVFCLTKKK